ncbi:hypothetical protein B2J93_3971 [Marssonina coronariae]|uniref:Uncharacterized protein n=1 Tax=Diplocarpon coronariae TaxID=2795749 RepID=A0A218YV28_9HELO|nr:hypothetical protein B2J93_3971 [Marssonina coronariae]
MASDGNEYDADSPHGLPRGSVQQRGSPGDWREISSSASRPAARRRRNIGPQARGRASTLASINTSGSGSTSINTRTSTSTNTSNNTSIHTEANSPLPPINTILRPERNLAVVFPVTATYHSQHSSHERNWPDDSGPRCSSLAAPVVTPHYSQCYGRVRSGLDSELSRYSQKRAPRPGRSASRPSRRSLPDFDATFWQPLSAHLKSTSSRRPSLGGPQRQPGLGDTSPSYPSTSSRREPGPFQQRVESAAGPSDDTMSPPRSGSRPAMSPPPRHHGDLVRSIERSPPADSPEPGASTRNARRGPNSEALRGGHS